MTVGCGLTTKLHPLPHRGSGPHYSTTAVTHSDTQICQTADLAVDHVTQTDTHYIILHVYDDLHTLRKLIIYMYNDDNTSLALPVVAQVVLVSLEGGRTVPGLAVWIGDRPL